MSIPGTKLIRVRCEVYDQLEDFQIKHESFSGTIFRLLEEHEQMRKMLKPLAGEPPEKDQRR